MTKKKKFFNLVDSMLVPRSQMGCLVLDDCLYVIGGTNRRNEVLQSVERYHFKEDRYTPPWKGLNRTVRIRHQCRKTTALTATDVLLTLVLKMNI